MSPPDLNIAIDRDGSIRLNGERIQVPNIDLKRQIGRGANAVVFLGENPFLKRQVAVKLWLPSARIHDRRDKFRQGIHEARKVSSLDDPCIIRVYDAGEASRLFYLSMEFYPSVTLKEWLTLLERPFILRRLLAQDIFRVISHANRKGIFHGDLHPRNILIHQDDTSYLWPFRSRNEKPVVDFRVIDFGTSYFSESGFSLARHWRVLEETLDHLLQPLKMRPLWYHVRPSDITDHIMMDMWFSEYLDNLAVLLQIGFRGSSLWKMYATQRPKEEGKLYLRREVELTPEGLAFLRRVKETGALSSGEVEGIFPRDSAP